MKVKIISKISGKTNKRFIALAVENEYLVKCVSFDKVLIYELLPEDYSIKYLWENDCEIYL